MLWEQKETATWNELSEVLRLDPAWGSDPLTQEEAELDIRNSGFLLRELDDKWRFVHRSISEYFAARAEVDRLQAGERPRYVPTDGYRLFLTELLARYWLESGEPPIPPRAWLIARGDEVRSNQWSLLAAATKMLPEGVSVTLSGIDAVKSEENLAWAQTNFNSVSLTISAGYVTFTKCKFTNCQIVVIENPETVTDFADCTYYNTTLRFSVFPDWITPHDISGGRGTAEVPIAVLDFSRAVEGGADVYVGGVKWSLCERDLYLFVECTKRLRGKVYAHNFLRGAYANELERLLPSLIKRQFVEEDSSRQSHQLNWSSRGRALVTRLRSHPVSAQAELAALFLERDAEIS
jgi:hypothetical protein